ncbi:MAG TPA: hypothetical protein PLX23_07970 [Candidatus Hydrogenedens sp.]|nr:hypothetical protein [Candidatus Hydrogenedens sp.]
MYENIEKDEHKKEESTPKSSWYRNPALRFVVIFIIVVISFLTAYRYLIPTTFNDRYLFTLAVHTSWVLNKIGDSSALEGLPLDKSPEECRAWLVAWARGAEQPSPEDYINVKKGPLTPWEQWSYRAQRAREQGVQTKLGPRVVFVLREGLTQKITRIEEKISELKNNHNLSEPEKASLLAKYNDELHSLLFQDEEAQKNPEERQKISGYVFPFVIISECGAIEIMAIFFAAIIAFPTFFRKKLLGVIVGIPLMYFVNIFRLSFLAVVGALNAGGKWFEFLHYYVWQAIYIVFVVAVWLVWIEFVVYAEEKKGVSFRERISQIFQRRTLLPLVQTLAFCIKFIVIVIPLVCIWWWLIPIYGWILVQISGSVLRFVLGVPILAGGVRPSGFLNTGSTIYFLIQGYEFEKTSPIALLITNLPPFISLMLVTRISWLSRLKKIIWGSVIIILGHILFIVIVLRYQEILKEYSELPVAVIQFYLTMPFMLWIAMVFRDLFLKRSEENIPPKKQM